jgi:HD domain
MITSAALWAKLKRDAAGRVVTWHSLVDHSADVAAALETLLLQPVIRRRLATAAGRTDLDEVTRARLGALSFLHDIGKANRGFRARVDPQAPPVAYRQIAEWALRAIRRASWRSALIVFIAVDGRPIGALLLADELRSDTPHAIRMLREAGVARIVMVTGVSHPHARLAQ